MGGAELHYMSAVDALAAFRAGELSPVELTRAVLDQIERYNERHNPYNLVDAERALEQARDSEQRWSRGRPLGLLDGVPVAIKDLILTRGWPTLRGSRAIEVDQPWDVDAPITRLLRNAGAVLIGKTTTPELGWKAVTDSPLTGVTTNPWDVTRTAGGSSGGSGVAVALGMATLAVGTDGGGSIRIPAAFVGIVGFKPTFGRVPLWPVSPFGTLAHGGPMARTVGDAALMMDVVAQPDSFDWQSLPQSATGYRSSLEDGVAGLRVAFSPNLGYGNVDPEVAAAARAAAHTFAALGAHVEEVDPGFDDPLEAFTVLWYAGAAQALVPFDQASRARMDRGLLEIAAEGAGYSALRYLDAVMQRGNLGVHMSRFHDRFDLLLTPSVPIPAFEAGREVPTHWPSRRWPTWTPFSYPFNLTQQPAISLPCGFTSSHLPIGLQIVGARYKDALVLRAAHAYQSAHSFGNPQPG
jgi:aspartyl-tRNA(Asn)/glutamyl-tRNA(Gln) amidotransferase subunit A